MRSDFFRSARKRQDLNFAGLGKGHQLLCGLTGDAGGGFQRHHGSELRTHRRGDAAREFEVPALGQVDLPVRVTARHGRFGGVS